MFAKKNTTMNDIKEQIDDKEVCMYEDYIRIYYWYFLLQKQLRNIEDASDELMLIDDDQRIPYPKILLMYEGCPERGQTFVYLLIVVTC